MDLLKDKKNKTKKEVRVCKKCGRKLPKDYKHKTCEACRTSCADVGKTVGKVVAGVVVGAVSITATALLSSKNKK